MHAACCHLKSTHLNFSSALGPIAARGILGGGIRRSAKRRGFGGTAQAPLHGVDDRGKGATLQRRTAHQEAVDVGLLSLRSARPAVQHGKGQVLGGKGPEARSRKSLH